jgi:hydrophobe/amphiphile efflux-3 (HAE3) family protein
MWKRLAELIARRPVAVLIAALFTTAALGTGLTRLEFRTDQDTLVDPSSQVYLDNIEYQDRFGGETMLVLFTGDPVGLFGPANLERIEALEAELRATPGVATVVGPHSAVSYAADQLSVAPELLMAGAARAPDPLAYGERLVTESQRLAAAGEQSLANPDFVRFLLFSEDGTLRDAQRTAFPDEQHSLLIAQIEGNASIDEQGQVAQAVKDVVAGYRLDGQVVLVTGTPVLLDEINAYLQGGMATLGAIALAVMVAVLWVAFRVRWRLLPLAVMGAGTAAALGAAVLLGIDLSLVTISGLPIFIGLGVDFAIQMHNRYAEQRGAGDPPETAARAAVRAMAAPLTVAMAAGAFGFLALRLSSVPMIRDFGLLLCLGVVLLVSAAIVMPLCVLVLADRRHDRRHGARVASATRAGLLERVVGHLTSLPRSIVGAVFIVGVVAAGVGFTLEDRMPIDTEVEHWVSPDGEAVQELEALRAATGFSTQLGIMIEADDVTRDDVVAWIHEFQTIQLAKHKGALIQAASMPGIAADVVGITPTGSDVTTLLGVTPDDIRSSLVTDDLRSANLQFMLGDMSLGARGDLMDEIQADLDGSLAPPEGVTVTQSGLAVIGIELVEGMEANRRVLTLASLGLVAASLLVLGRFRLRSILPIVPVAVAVGIAILVLFAFGFELTPLTTVAAPLVIAVATEFTVLLQARYREERARGRSPEDAVRALTNIGRAFVASGLTLVGGFAVMAASPMPLLRDFGVVVAIDVVIALAAALVLMPPLLRWSDRTGRVAPTTDTTTATLPEALEPEDTQGEARIPAEAGELVGHR